MVVVKVPQKAASRGPALSGISLDRWIGLSFFVLIGVALLAFAIFGNASRVGSGPPLVSLVFWGVLGWRLFRRFL